MVIIPCCHTYSSHCLTKWQETEKTCSICRGLIEGTNVNWSLLRIVPQDGPIEFELKTFAEKQLEMNEKLQKEFEKHFKIK